MSLQFGSVLVTGFFFKKNRFLQKCQIPCGFQQKLLALESGTRSSVQHRVDFFAKIRIFLLFSSQFSSEASSLGSMVKFFVRRHNRHSGIVIWCSRPGNSSSEGYGQRTGFFVRIPSQAQRWRLSIGASDEGILTKWTRILRQKRQPRASHWGYKIKASV